MELFLRFLVTMAIGAVGGWAGRKLKLPAGSLVGAMALVIVFNLITQAGFYPPNLRIAVQICSGALVGSRITRADVIALKRIIVPTLMLVGCMLVMNLVTGFGMIQISDLDPTTALFACAPGGLSDMALISGDMGANPAYVALLQLVRQQTIFIVMPPLFRKIFKKEAAQRAAACAEPVREPHKNPEPAPETPKQRQEKIGQFCLTMLVAAAGGLLFWRIGVRAGAMIGAMLATAAYNILRGGAFYPSSARRYTQIFTGAYVGLSLDRASFLALRELIGPALLLIAAVIVFTWASALLIHKTTKLELTTCMMACTPGGLTEMSLLADDLGGDTPKIALMQTVRMMSVVALFPTILSFVLGLLGG